MLAPMALPRLYVLAPLVCALTQPKALGVARGAAGLLQFVPAVCSLPRQH